MAQYFTDFSEYTSSQAPSDWTSRWATITATVEDDAGATGGKLLRTVRSSTTARWLLSWDDIDGDADRDDFEILTRMRFTINASQIGGIAGRGAGSSSSETAYYFRFDGQNNRVAEYVSGTGATIASNAEAYTTDTWYWVRFRANTTTLQLRRWTGTIGDEPGTWDIDTSDSSITAAGWIGVQGFSVNTIDYDIFGIGTNGDTAPSSAVSSTLDQEGFRWRDDDGDEDAASWLNTQDSNISRPMGVTTRLRILTDATGDPGSQSLKLQFRKVGESDWIDV